MEQSIIYTVSEMELTKTLTPTVSTFMSTTRHYDQEFQALPVECFSVSRVLKGVCGMKSL